MTVAHSLTLHLSTKRSARIQKSFPKGLIMCLYLSIIFFLFTSSSFADRRVIVPFRFDLELIRQQMIPQIYTEPGTKAAILEDAHKCQYIYLLDPEISVVSGKLKIVSRVEAQSGMFINDQCLSAQPVQAYLETVHEGSFDSENRMLVLRVVDSNLYDQSRSRNLSNGPLVSLVKEHLNKRLGETKIPFAPLIEDLRSILEQTLPWPKSQIYKTIDSLHFSKPVFSDGSMLVHMSFSVPDTEQYVAHAPEPALTPEELTQFQKRLEQLDAFITFIIKQFARYVPMSVRPVLVEILLDARHELVSTLSSPPQGIEDPVKQLFLHTWQRLSPVLRDTLKNSDASAAASYLSFITATDALAALNAAGPELGIEITSDGLRRLARMLNAGIADPLIYSLDIDPELRDIFGFGPPLPPPDVPPNFSLPLSQNRTTILDILPVNVFSFFPDLSLVGYAFAQYAQDDFKRLNGWVPSSYELNQYLPLVQRLLQNCASTILQRDDLPDLFRSIYNDLVLATAWQESCWRQFIRKNDKIMTLTSAAGSVGIMQVNAKVWRGVYDIKGIYADIGYNAAAGCEILFYYMKNFAIQKGEHLQPGGPDNIARATYAAYNAGPSQLTRYRDPSIKQNLKQIDSLFWIKYTAVKEGRVGEVANCY